MALFGPDSQLTACLLRQYRRRSRVAVSWKGKVDTCEARSRASCGKQDTKKWNFSLRPHNLLYLQFIFSPTHPSPLSALSLSFLPSPRPPFSLGDPYIPSLRDSGGRECETFRLNEIFLCSAKKRKSPNPTMNLRGG